MKVCIEHYQKLSLQPPNPLNKVGISGRFLQKREFLVVPYSDAANGSPRTYHPFLMIELITLSWQNKALQTLSLKGKNGLQPAAFQ